FVAPVGRPSGREQPLPEPDRARRAQAVGRCTSTDRQAPAGPGRGGVPPGWRAGPPDLGPLGPGRRAGRHAAVRTPEAGASRCVRDIPQRERRRKVTPVPEKNANTSALYAVAGAADAAVTALRDLPAHAPAFAQRAETL